MPGTHRASFRKSSAGVVGRVYVFANRCASSRTRWSSFTAGLSKPGRSGSERSADKSLELLRQSQDRDRFRAQRPKFPQAAFNWPRPPSIRIKSGRRARIPRTRRRASSPNHRETEGACSRTAAASRSLGRCDRTAGRRLQWLAEVPGAGLTAIISSPAPDARFRISVRAALPPSRIVSAMLAKSSCCVTDFIRKRW